MPDKSLVVLEKPIYFNMEPVDPHVLIRMYIRNSGGP